MIVIQLFPCRESGTGGNSFGGIITEYLVLPNMHNLIIKPCFFCLLEESAASIVVTFFLMYFPGPADEGTIYRTGKQPILPS